MDVASLPPRDKVAAWRRHGFLLAQRPASAARHGQRGFELLPRMTTEGITTECKQSPSKMSLTHGRLVKQQANQHCWVLLHDVSTVLCDH